MSRADVILIRAFVIVGTPVVVPWAFAVRLVSETGHAFRCAWLEAAVEFTDARRAWHETRYTKRA